MSNGHGTIEPTPAPLPDKTDPAWQAVQRFLRIALGTPGLVEAVEDLRLNMAANRRWLARHRRATKEKTA